MSLQLFNDSNMQISPRTSASNTTILSPQFYTNELIEFKPFEFEYLFARILTDIKSLMILFILIMTLPNIIYDTHNNDNDNDNIYGGTHYQCRYNNNNYISYTSIYYVYDTTHNKYVTCLYICVNVL